MKKTISIILSVVLFLTGINMIAYAEDEQEQHPCGALPVTSVEELRGHYDGRIIEADDIKDFSAEEIQMLYDLGLDKYFSIDLKHPCGALPVTSVEELRGHYDGRIIEADDIKDFSAEEIQMLYDLGLDQYFNMNDESKSLSNKILSKKNVALPAAPLPSAVDNTSLFPQPGDQQTLKSCVAWAIAYAAKSGFEKQETGWSINSQNHHFSALYLYNKINNGQNTDVNIINAFNALKNYGDCSELYYPNTLNYAQGFTAIQDAAANLYSEGEWISTLGTVNNIKQLVSEGKGVIINIKIYPDFDDLDNQNNTIFDNISGTSRGNHALCIIGYNDSMGGHGAFKVINSWGSSWGMNGYGWISYDIISNINTTLLNSVFYLTNYDNSHYNYIIGDADLNGTVNSADARLVLRFAAQTETPTARQFALSDADGNANVNSSDARYLLQFAAHIISRLPIYD